VPALATLPVAIPLLVAALLVGAGPLLRRRAADIVAILTAATVTGLGAAMLVRTLGGTTVTWFGGWTPRSGIALGIAFAIDPVGAGMVTFAGLLMTAALTFSWRYFDTVGTLFHALMLVLLAAVAGFSSSGDLFNLFVFFELLSVSSYALAGYKIEDPGSLQGALNFAVTNSIGAVLVLTGVGLLYGRTGALNLAQIGTTLASAPADRLVIVAFVLLMVGFFVKAAVVPFHFWLADAYAVAPTPVGVLMAGLLSELGVYAVARVYWTVFSGPFDAHTPGLRAALLVGATLTALVGGVMCMLQHHLARLVAFATVSHVGLTLVGIALLEPEGLAGAALYALADGLVKAALFVMVGILAHRFGTLDELELRGRGRALPWAAPLLALGALGLAGAAPFGTFAGKALIEEGAHGGALWVAALFTAVSAMTAGAVLRATGRIFVGWGPAALGGGDEAAKEAAHREGPEQEQELHVARSRIAPSMLAPALVLLGGSIAIGMVPGLSDRAIVAATRFADRTAYAGAVLGGATAAPHVTVTASAGARLVAAAPWTAVTLVLAVAGAAAALFGRRLPARPRRRALRLVLPAVRTLRRLHSGHLADSVTWLVIGTAGFGALLAATLR
jgi:multicomponent Na+:H+ antiporter subunit D